MVVDIGVVRKYIKPKADSTLYNMRKVDLIEYIRTFEHNYNVAVSFNENQAKYIESLCFNGGVVQQWIPVTERLPQEDLPFGALCEVVQVLLNDGSVTIGWCNRGLRLWFHMPIRETKIVGYEYEKTPVIAWQPLSQPPSGAKNE